MGVPEGILSVDDEIVGLFGRTGQVSCVAADMQVWLVSNAVTIDTLMRRVVLYCMGCV